MSIKFSNKLYSKIFKKVSTSVGFRNTNVGLVNKIIPKHKNFQYNELKYATKLRRQAEYQKCFEKDFIDEYEYEYRKLFPNSAPK